MEGQHRCSASMLRVEQHGRSSQSSAGAMPHISSCSCMEVFMPPESTVPRSSTPQTMATASWSNKQTGQDEDAVSSDASGAPQFKYLWTDYKILLATDGSNHKPVEAGSIHVHQDKLDHSASFSGRYHGQDSTAKVGLRKSSSMHGFERVSCSFTEAAKAAAAAAARSANASPRLQRALARSLRHSHSSQREDTCPERPLNRSLSAANRTNMLQRLPSINTGSNSPQQHRSTHDGVHLVRRSPALCVGSFSPPLSPVARKPNATTAGNVEQGELQELRRDLLVRLGRFRSAPKYQHLSRLVTSTSSSVQAEAI